MSQNPQQTIELLLVQLKQLEAEENFDTTVKETITRRTLQRIKLGRRSK